MAQKELIENLTPRDTFYLGSGPDGEILLRGEDVDDEGRELRVQRKTNMSSVHDLDTNMIMALAINECCANIGVGKVSIDTSRMTETDGIGPLGKRTERTSS